ncbi:MAG TPA: hypothetical protein DHW63_12095 [Hyphomonadaceae bacterium]|nr:hypothetical protein [Hyphomonadaceae bacterium]
MADDEPFDAEKVANLTQLQLRRIEEQTLTLMEIALRQDERTSRVERDIGEIKRDIGEIRSEMVLMENRLLNQTTPANRSSAKAG